MFARSIAIAVLSALLCSSAMAQVVDPQNVLIR